MSTAPDGWAAPKTDWTPADGVADTDANRWEGNISAIETGERTLDPTQTPSTNKGSLRQILDWVVNRIKAIVGGDHWYSAPAVTLAQVKAHIDADITSGSVHSVGHDGVGMKGLFYFNVYSTPKMEHGLVGSLIPAGLTSKSVGPTGSGADIIWTAMDSVPVGARGVRLDASALLATGDEIYTLEFRPGTKGHHISVTGRLIPDQIITGMNVYDVPINAQRVFDVLWNLQLDPSHDPNDVYWARTSVDLIGWYK